MAPDIDRTFSALADPHRRAIVELLLEKPLKPSEAADALSISRPALSRHLRVLRTAGLVELSTPEDDARARLIRLRRDPFTQLGAWLEHLEAFWGGQLAAFKAHAERTGKRQR